MRSLHAPAEEGDLREGERIVRRLGRGVFEKLFGGGVVVVAAGLGGEKAFDDVAPDEVAGGRRRHLAGGVQVRARIGGLAEAAGGEREAEGFVGPVAGDFAKDFFRAGVVGFLQARGAHGDLGAAQGGGAGGELRERVHAQAFRQRRQAGGDGRFDGGECRAVLRSGFAEAASRTGVASSGISAARVAGSSASSASTTDTPVAVPRDGRRRSCFPKVPRHRVT